MLALGFLLTSSLVSGQHQVSGVGRLNSGSAENVQFNLDVYASAVNEIVSSVSNGPNRTTSQCFPVEKLYGVNVRIHYLGFLLLLKALQIGNWLLSEPWFVRIRTWDEILMFTFAGWARTRGWRWMGKSAITALLAGSQNGRLPPILVARRPTRYLSNVSIIFLFFTLWTYLRIADWESWLTQDDVDGMVAAGLNSIRVPLGFWIIEDIVDQTHEP